MNPMLMCDYYKTVHADMLPAGITKSVSYLFPRGSRIPEWNHAVFFGLRGFIKEYLVDRFDEFFATPWEDNEREIREVLSATLNEADAEAFVYRAKDLWFLGRLPIEVYALPEGSHVPMGVPMLAITNTHGDFAWLPQFLESLISCEMWHGIVAATVADKFRGLVNKWYERTSEADPRYALSLFSMRGEESLSSATKSGAAWATSFVPCATVPSAVYLRDCYDAKPGESIKGSPSTEHAVMCSNYAVDGNEEDLIVALLENIYPHTSFSVVLDSYDYWHMVNETLFRLKDKILAHDGCMLVRGDSGDPVEAVVKTVFSLWASFGGTVNSKGYKVLDPHVKAIYGDSITLGRCEDIYRILEDNGFAADNVSLGVGSYSMEAIDIDGKHYPFTRDTFNMAIKCTYIEVDGEPHGVYKAPKGAAFKRSPHGCIAVWGEDGKYQMGDGLEWKNVPKVQGPGEGLTCVFREGHMLYGDSDNLNEIRARLENYRRK